MAPRVLVVEDQEDNLRIARDLLQSAGFTPLLARTGAEGVALAEQGPDLILMDIELPDMNGCEATRRIRAREERRRVPIIAVTSNALSGDEAAARAAGCDDYVTKPYSPRQLLARIRQLLDEARRGEA